MIEWYMKLHDMWNPGHIFYAETLKKEKKNDNTAFMPYPFP